MHIWLYDELLTFLSTVFLFVLKPQPPRHYMMKNLQMTVQQLLRLVGLIVSNFSSRSRLIRHLQREQTNASTQDEWMDLAERIDNIQGNDVWRSDPNCQLYERDRISARIDEFVHLMRRRDIFELMFELRGGIGRNKFGLLHEGLFSKALAGSKVLVETYVHCLFLLTFYTFRARMIHDASPLHAFFGFRYIPVYV